jgi:hypothetical protein
VSAFALDDLADGAAEGPLIPSSMVTTRGRSGPGRDRKGAAELVSVA